MSGAVENVSIPVVLQFITLVGPYFVSMFFILLSIINGDIKGFMYLFGIIIVYSIIALLKNTIPPNQTLEICSVLEKYHGQAPSFITALYVYTLIYMLVPMITYNQFNIQLILILVFIIIVDILIRSTIMKCINFVNIIFGIVIGGLIGGIWVMVLTQSGQKNLLFYEDVMSNKEKCVKPGNDNFTCDVYQYGKLIGHSLGTPPTTTPGISTNENIELAEPDVVGLDNPEVDTGGIPVSV